MTAGCLCGAGLSKAAEFFRLSWLFSLVDFSPRESSDASMSDFRFALIRKTPFAIAATAHTQGPQCFRGIYARSANFYAEVSGRAQSGIDLAERRIDCLRRDSHRFRLRVSLSANDRANTQQLRHNRSASAN